MRERASAGRLGFALLATTLAVAACTQSLPVPSTVPATPAGAQAPNQPLVVSAAYIRDTGPNRAVVGAPTTVSAHALGQRGVAALELWDGAQLVGVESASGSPSPALYARWSWVPAAAGAHLLLVRAVDAAGGVVQSNVLRIPVADALVEPPLGMAGRATAFAGNGQASPVSFAHMQTSRGISAPSVQASLDGCTATLALSGGAETATGFDIVGLPPAGLGFSRLDTIDPASDSDSRTVTLTSSGTFLFSATSFDSSVQAFSPPVEVTAPAECATSGWTGDVSLVEGKLIAPQAVDRAYLYMTPEQGAAVRVPAEEDTFVESGKNGELDFTPSLPAFDGSSLEIEAWGWQHGALIHLGNGVFSASPPAPGGGLTFGSTGPVQAGGALTTLNVIDKHLGSPSTGLVCATTEGEFCFVEEPLTAAVIERPPVGSSTPIMKKFRWTTVLAHVSQLVWQILPYPPASTADLAPPFLMDHGAIAVTPGQTEGDFSLDFNKYFEASVPTVKIGGSPENSVIVGPIFPSSNTASPTPGTGSGGTSDPESIQTTVGAFGGRFYVRLIPIEFNSAMLPSNSVTLDVVEPTEVEVPESDDPGYNQNAYTIEWTYSPPEGADSTYSRCAIVTAIDPGLKGLPGYAFYEGYLESGKPFCYSPPSDDGWSPVDVFEAFVEFVGDVWDYLGDGYEYIKHKVVEAVLIAVPCTQIASDAVCEQIATTALEVALASVGIPPNLPDFDAVVAGLKGELSTLIVEAASSLPGVAEGCGIAEQGSNISSKVKTCEELAAIAIDQLVEEVEQARSDAAGKSAGIWAAGVTFEPDPRGIFHSASVDLTITRTSDPQLPSQCSLSAWMESTKKNWTFPELWEGVPKDVTAAISGEPFLRASMLIPPLQPGESISRELWLTNPRIWFESQRAEWYWDYYQNLGSLPGFTRAWALLTFGAELTFGIESNCAVPSEQGPYVLPKDSIYSSNQ